MKKIFILSFLLFQTVFYSQDKNLGTHPVLGVTPIKRIDNGIPSNKETSTTIENVISAKTAGIPTGSSQEIGITEGSLSVSLTGAATYSIPIGVPPGINGVVPQIGLSYSSQGSNGTTGYGWNIAGVSIISRIPATKFHDGVIDGVDFNTLDRFSFDGQRLIAKNNAVYGANATEYETENFSNVKITSYGVSPIGVNYGPAYFVVQYPDGSIAQYGNSSDSRSIALWSINYWQNPQGVRISYTYSNQNNNVSITSIKYGATSTNTAINEIQFVYGTRQRPEQMYMGGQSIIINNILKEIKVLGNNIGFRNYTLGYNITTLGYERLNSITEKSGDNVKSYNPTVFTYEETPETISYSPIATNIGVGDVSLQNSATVSGDFDGDGKLDFLIYTTLGPNAKNKFWLFDKLINTSTNAGLVINIGAFDDIFPVSLLNIDNKFRPIHLATYYNIPVNKYFSV